MRDRVDPRLREQWLVGAIDACASITSRMDQEELIRLATRGLAACCSFSRHAPAEVHHVIRVGGAAETWPRAHDAFDAVRLLTLAHEQGWARLDELDGRLLFVAENAARVIYNASKPEDPFDSDSSAWLLKTLSHFLEIVPTTAQPQLLTALDDLLGFS